MPCGEVSDNSLVPNFKTVQFSARICFAITVNKSQEQSVSSRLGLNLCDVCFSYGQLYDALSRTPRRWRALVCGQRVDNATRNVLHPDAIL